MKKLFVGLGILVLVVMGVVLVAARNLDGIVKAAVEEAGTRVVGTDVRVDSVEIHLIKGRAILRNLTIANPEGYSDGAMIAIGEISADVDFRTGAIRDVQISQPYIFAEQKGRSSNFKTVRDHVSSKSQKEPKEKAPVTTGVADGHPGPKKSSPAPSAKRPAAEEKEPSTFQIDNFDMREAVVAYNVVDVGVTGRFSVARISFSGLNGTVEQVTKQALIQLASQVIANVVDEVADKGVKGLVTEHQPEIDKARSDIEKAASQIDAELGEKVKGAMDDVMKFLGN
ncbi:MAG: hypothetical protein O3C57_00865 [Verrucomicrobia bacterium]|nr:hypothetical protein [Verrucomicrobiota bacterium]